MQTLHEIEIQADAIKLRMAELHAQIKAGFGNDSQAAANAAIEFADLFARIKELETSLFYFQETAKQLMDAEPLGGPH
jgi:hypothetical protein